MINGFGREPSKPHVESALEFSIPEMPKTFRDIWVHLVIF